MARAKEVGVVAQRRNLPRETQLLVGRVRVEGFRPPVMLIEVWCPYCKRVHVHGWSADDRRADHVEHRVAHCVDGSPLQGQGYYIGLDPAAREENRRAFAAFDRLVAAAVGRNRRPERDPYLDTSPTPPSAPGVRRGGAVGRASA